MSTKSTSKAVTVEGITKFYGKKQVLHDIHFSLQYGEIMTILGPNGSGKTTIMEILEGVRTHNRGTFSVLGGAPTETAIKERIGVAMQDPEGFSNLKVQEIISLYRAAYTQSLSLEETLDRVSLLEKKNERVHALSGGEKQRLNLAAALVNDPELLFLDEPTAGLDPDSSRSFRELILEEKRKGKTVLLTTHSMGEAESISDKIGFLYEGRLIDQGTPAELIRSIGRGSRVSFRIKAVTQEEYNDSFQDALPRAFKAVSSEEGKYCFYSHTLEEDLEELWKITKKNSVELFDLSIEPSNLEDFFLARVGSPWKKIDEE